MDCKVLTKTLALLLVSIVTSTATAKEPEELLWDDMIPLKDTQAGSGFSSLDPEAAAAVIEDPWAYLDFTQPVEELDGRYVKVPGFVVPLESDEGGMLSEFLLVPYFGACIHTPPPPPNQIVYVTFDEPVDVTSTWDPYWVIGTINTKPYMGDIADTVYQLAGERLEDYEE